MNRIMELGMHHLVLLLNFDCKLMNSKDSFINSQLRSIIRGEWKNVKCQIARTEQMNNIQNAIKKIIQLKRYIIPCRTGGTIKSFRTCPDVLRTRIVKLRAIIEQNYLVRQFFFRIHNGLIRNIC